VRLRAGLGHLDHLSEQLTSYQQRDFSFLNSTVSFDLMPIAHRISSTKIFIMGPSRPSIVQEWPLSLEPVPDVIAPQPGRYTKRARKVVKYYESEDENDAYDVGKRPQAKVNTASPDLRFSAERQQRARMATEKSKLHPKEKTFPFMNLPAELRNKIYEFTLSDPSGHHLVSRTKHYRRGVKRISVKEFKDSIKAYDQRPRSSWRQTAAVASAEEVHPPFSHLAPVILAVSKGGSHSSLILLSIVIPYAYFSCKERYGMTGFK
jgi:hypothetical protein